jgi:endonuclease YncB( thermonuclease family)
VQEVEVVDERSTARAARTQGAVKGSDQPMFDRYDRLLAYVRLPSGRQLNRA